MVCVCDYAILWCQIYVMHVTGYNAKSAVASYNVCGVIVDCSMSPCGFVHLVNGCRVNMCIWLIHSPTRKSIACLLCFCVHSIRCEPVWEAANGHVDKQLVFDN
jgi:hypothetical protein